MFNAGDAGVDGYYAILGLNADGDLASFHAFEDPISGTTSTSPVTMMLYNSGYKLGDDKFLNDSGFTIAIAPEPTSGLLLLLGVAGLALRRRRA